ncbi:hypothetical protein, partial [Streptomyces sp. NPDC048659]|uniref:hypothetical protein n=1 Tax=Streptomyces sp. NPDC048659 TaxID=3155489 RepID=UPI0034159073
MPATPDTAPSSPSSPGAPPRRTLLAAALVASARRDTRVPWHWRVPWRRSSARSSSVWERRPDLLGWAKPDALVDGLSELGLTMLIF